MSLVLSASEPKGLSVKTHGVAGMTGIVFLGGYEIELKDFLYMADYVLTNTNLEGDNDPRLQFVEHIKSLSVATGFNNEGKRLYPPDALDIKS